MNKNFIVLNGKKYDATTGALLGTVSDSQFTPMKKPLTQHRAAKPIALAPPLKVVKKADRSHHTAAKHISARKPTGSQTLMRSAVKKPAMTPLHPAVKQHYPLQAHPSAILPKISVNNIDPKRLHRAKQIGRSANIGRYQSISHQRITPRMKPVPVAVAPAIHVTKPATPSPKNAMFEQALHHAKSHEQPAHKPHKAHKSKAKTHSNHRHFLHSLATLSAVLVIGGCIAYVNKSSVELQLASVRAGFQASAPGYAPAGFQKQATVNNDGKVAINFVSPLDKSKFTITQQSSDWNSQTLFDSVVAQNNNSYQTVLSNGRTIYMYGDNQATWVDGGILYNVGGNAKLSKDQISALASSM